MTIRLRTQFRKRDLLLRQQEPLVKAVRRVVAVKRRILCVTYAFGYLSYCMGPPLKSVCLDPFYLLPYVAEERVIVSHVLLLCQKLLHLQTFRGKNRRRLLLTLRHRLVDRRADRNTRSRFFCIVADAF